MEMNKQGSHDMVNDMMHGHEILTYLFIRKLENKEKLGFSNKPTLDLHAKNENGVTKYM